MEENKKRTRWLAALALVYAVCLQIAVPAGKETLTRYNAFLSGADAAAAERVPEAGGARLLGEERSAFDIKRVYLDPRGFAYHVDLHFGHRPSGMPIPPVFPYDLGTVADDDFDESEALFLSGSLEPVGAPLWRAEAAPALEGIYGLVCAVQDEPAVPFLVEENGLSRPVVFDGQAVEKSAYPLGCRTAGGAPAPVPDGEESEDIAFLSGTLIPSGDVYVNTADTATLSGAVRGQAGFRRIAATVRDSKGTAVWSGSCAPSGDFTFTDIGLPVGEGELTVAAVVYDGTVLTKTVRFRNNSQGAASAMQTDNSDADGDGLSGYFEEYLGSDPENSDTDGDGASDGFELCRLFSDPLDASDRAGDSDRDGDGAPASEEEAEGRDPAVMDSHALPGMRWSSPSGNITVSSDGPGLSAYDGTLNFLLPAGRPDGLPDEAGLIGDPVELWPPDPDADCRVVFECAVGAFGQGSDPVLAVLDEESQCYRVYPSRREGSALEAHITEPGAYRVIDRSRWNRYMREALSP